MAMPANRNRTLPSRTGPDVPMIPTLIGIRRAEPRCPHLEGLKASPKA
jgi:hypothetical protein